MPDDVLQVTAGVILRGERVLVCQRRLGGHHPGKWEFPGGKVEPGEDLVAGIRREIKEELDIDATVGRVLWQTRHHYAGREPIALTFFLVPEFTGTVTNCVFAALAWRRIAELPDVDFVEGDREFVAALVDQRVKLD